MLPSACTSTVAPFTFSATSPKPSPRSISLALLLPSAMLFSFSLVKFSRSRPYGLPSALVLLTVLNTHPGTHRRDGLRSLPINSRRWLRRRLLQCALPKRYIFRNRERNLLAFITQRTPLKNGISNILLNPVFGLTKPDLGTLARNGIDKSKNRVQLKLCDFRRLADAILIRGNIKSTGLRF